MTLCFQSQHPDGHRAPIRDLVGRPSFGPPTPPHNLGLTSQASNASPYPSSPSPSPYSPHPSSPHPSSPSQASHSSTSFNETSDTPTGMSFLSLPPFLSFPLSLHLPFFLSPSLSPPSPFSSLQLFLSIVRRVLQIHGFELYM